MTLDRYQQVLRGAGDEVQPWEAAAALEIAQVGMDGQATPLWEPDEALVAVADEELVQDEGTVERLRELARRG